MSSEAMVDFAAALTHAREEGKLALQELAEDHLSLVAAMVRRFPWHNKEKEELYQQGCVGLMKALARFDPTYGVRFSTYAAAMILGEMRMLCRLDAPIHIPRGDRELRSRIRKAEGQLTAHLGRSPTVQELASLLRMDAAELILAMEQIQVTSTSAESARPLLDLLPDQDDWMTRLLLRDIIERLPFCDQRLLLLRLRFGKTQAETARALGITQVQVSRREATLKQQIRQAWLAAE
ncbi:MAG: sigma-70 family RNA polymerase sigma factor [Clostridia bacterium]|nr:sigma-70 family RNA polymerase sigma factor [Clostridia bacterium]